MFTEVFKRFNGDLPSITKAIIGFSDFFNQYFFHLLVVLGAIIGLIYYFRKTTWFRKYSSFLLLKLPLVGKLSSKVYSARFCHSMALLVTAKVPMLRAIDLVEKMIGFYPFEKAMVKIKDGIMRGDFLYESLLQFSFFDTRLTSLVKVAEEVNKLDTVFSELSNQYSDEIEYRVSIMSSILEPLLIVFVGLLVGVILIAMYLPMFQLSTGIG